MKKITYKDLLISNRKDLIKLCEIYKKSISTPYLKENTEKILLGRFY